MENWLDLPDLVEQVQELFDLNLFDDGLSLLEQYKDIYSSEWEVHFLLSRAYSERNKPEQALYHLKQGLKYNKDNPDCLLGLFFAYNQMNELQKGARYLFKAKKLYPDNELILNALIWYYSETNNFHKAVSCYESAKSILNYNPEALRNAGIAYERLGDYNKALLCFKMSLELDPDADETRDLLADHYILREEMAKAIELYKNHLSKSPRNIKAMSRLTFCLTQNGQAPEAEKIATDIIRIYPNSPVGYIDLSYVYLNNNRIELAIETANKALDASPIDAEAVRVKAIAYAELKNSPLAEQCFKEALQLSPDNPEILRDFYHFLRSTGRFEEMEALVQKVIDQEYPYCMEDFWFFADYYRENGQNRKAFHFLNKAYRCMPGEKEIIPPMAEILFEMGHTSFAVPLLKKYVETKGWDDMMKELTRHKKMQGARSQEGMRLLQFHGQKLVEYRKFIFTFYIKKFLLVSFYTLSCILTVLSYLFYRLEGLLIFSLFYISTVFSFKITAYLIEKRRMSK